MISRNLLFQACGRSFSEKQRRHGGKPMERPGHRAGARQKKNRPAFCRTAECRKTGKLLRREGRVCAGNPGRVSRAISIISFQNFFKVLKTCSGCRKYFFDSLRGRPFGRPLLLGGLRQKCKNSYALRKAGPPHNAMGRAGFCVPQDQKPVRMNISGLSGWADRKLGARICGGSGEGGPSGYSHRS